MSVTSIERLPIAALSPYRANARTHSQRQISQIARSIAHFGFNNPVLIDDQNTILCGHGRVAAARLLGLTDVPVVRLSHLTEAQKRAYILADNKLAEEAGWDRSILAIEFQALIDLGFDTALTGFAVAEIDIVIGEAEAADPAGSDTPDDALPLPPPTAVSRPGDVWTLGPHRIACGDARDSQVHAALMAGDRARLVFTDPPYNVPVAGHVRTSGAHREFAMATGEMDGEAFKAFLKTTLGNAAAHAADGALAFVCMDWRHMEELLAAGRAVFSELKNLCVWTKTNGGMGSLYRSQHELVFVYKLGTGPHINNVELGRSGRNRTNVWSYAGVSSFGGARREDLAMHPTVKPVALVEDALKDASRRGDVILDPFGGSGTTLIAAEKSGRFARLIECDPIYVDVTLSRYRRLSSKPVLHASTGKTYAQIAEERGLPPCA
jgi:DNA modification methylase